MKSWSARGVLLAAAAILVGWMHYWGSEQVEASKELVNHHASIAREFEVLPYVPELGAQGNADLAERNAELRGSAAAFARDSLRDAQARQERARFMLVDVSRWASVGIALAMLGAFLARYRLGVSRRDSSGDPLIGLP